MHSVISAPADDVVAGRRVMKAKLRSFDPNRYVVWDAGIDKAIPLVEPENGEGL
jgi:hypothetical protein